MVLTLLLWVVSFFFFNCFSSNSLNSLALGYGATVNGINSYALGTGAFVDGDKSICWGGDVLKLNDNLFTIDIDVSSSSKAYLNGKNSILKGQNNKVVNAIASTVVGNNYDLSNVFGITAYNGLIASNGLIIVNSTFTSNNASNRGGSVYVESNSKLLVVNSTFNNSDAGEGAAIYGVNLSKVDVNKSSFKLNTANKGGTVFLNNASNVQFIDSKFINNTALNNNGGAINAAGSNISVIRSEFNNNSAYRGGAIYVVDSLVFTVRNSTFEDNKAKNNFGGAISLLGGANIYYSDFNRNTALYRGGAIHSSETTNKATRVYNSNFDANGVTTGVGNHYGGAIFYADVIENCNFTNNYAHSGGAIYQWKDHGYRLTVKNSTFINNKATDVAGAAYAHYGGNFIDCKFYGNTAGGSGGAIGGWNQIAQDCLFVNNRAKLGGAVGGESARSYNSIYINNSASYLGGSIYGFNLIVNNNKIFNSTSDNNGGAIGTIEYLDSDKYWTSSTFRNNTIINASAKNNGGAVYLYDHPQVNVYKTTFDSNKIIDAKAKNGGGLYSDSVALTLTNNQFENVEATAGGAIYNNRTMKLLNNKFVNSNADLGSDIYNARNIAVSYLTFIDNSTKYGSYLTNITIFATLTDDMGNTITGQNVTFEINGKKYYAQSIEGNASFIYTVDFASGSKIVNGSYAGSNLSDTVIKTGLIVSNLAKLNIDKSIDIKKYYVGDIAKYTIKLSNAENFTAYDVVVEDFLAPGLEFIDGKVSKGSYTNGLWTIGELYSHEEAEFVYYCTFTKDGSINNTAYVTSVNSESKKSSAVINVLPHNPDIHVVKKALDSVVILGNQARFEFVVNNTGTLNLTDVTIVEDSFDGLEFAGYVESSLWSHSIVNGKHVWTLNEVLSPNRVVSLFVNFNTLSTGTFVNNAIVKSDKTGEELVNALVTVVKPEMEVEKICLTPSVVLGNQARFEIIVNNTGSVDLSDVTVCEDSFDGLEYADYIKSSFWNHSLVNGKHVWTLNEVLSPNRVVSLFVNFNTLNAGTFVNNAIVKSDKTGEELVNALVNVVKPEMRVEKICLTPGVVLGNQARFEIIVNNTGTVDLSDVTVCEESFDGLEYADYIKSSFWNHSLVNGKHVWTLNEVLAPGRIVSLIVNFNAPNSGIFVNNAIVKSDKTGEELVNALVNVVKPEIKVEKICLTPSVVLGNQARFEIIVNNTGTVDLSDVTLYEDSFEGLVFDSYEASDRWIYSYANNIPAWTFKEVLPAGEWVSLTAVFNTTANGTFTNYASVKSNMSQGNAKANVNVLKPEMTVEKVTLTPNVILGEIAQYEIVIHNNGQTDLTNIIVQELPDKSLIYDHYQDSGLFSHSIVNGVHTWALNKLSSGAYAGFIIYYRTANLGTAVNTINVKSTEIEEISVYNTTNVLLPSFTVEKIALKPYVLINNQTIFEIVIRNTGEVPLNDVFVIEESYGSLIYDGALGDGIWTHELVEGKHKWTLNQPLQSKEFIGLFLRFNTTEVTGNITNTIIAGSSETPNKTANATVEVFRENVPEPPVYNSSEDVSYEVFKSVITQEIILNNQVTFQVVIHNNGQKDIQKIHLTELPPQGIIYDSFIDYLDLWTYDGDLTWSSKRAIYAGEYVGFFITFNTTEEGTFTNTVRAAADGGNITFANASFNVLKPDFTIEKVLVENNIANGSQAVFEIVIHNTGKTSLNNLLVKEYSFEGLVYDSFIDYLDLWTYNGDLSWTMQSLLPGEYVAFFVVFNTTGVGNFTNVVAANSSECADKYSNAVVSVLNEEFDISMICLNPLAVLGNQVTFEITVQNTGKLDLSSLKLSEISFDGLIFDHYNDYLRHWIYNNDLTWNLNKTLVPREITSLFVVFNTTDVGNYTNTVFAEILKLPMDFYQLMVM